MIEKVIESLAMRDMDSVHFISNWRTIVIELGFGIHFRG